MGGSQPDTLSPSPPDPQAHRLLMHITQCLHRLPINVDVLRRTSLGRTFAKLGRASHAPEAAAACRDLVEHWKQAVEAGTAAAGGAPGKAAGPR